MPGKGTDRRSIRIPDDVWDAARRKAEQEGTTVSDVIRRALQTYVGKTGK